MGDAYDHELKLALEEGLLSPEEAAELGAKTGAQQGAPLDRLVQDRRISAEKATELRGRALTLSSALTIPLSPEEGPGSDSAATVPSNTGAAAPRTPRHVPAFPVRDWDRYIPIRLLGQGGMGSVFLATDTRLGRQVALKFVRTENARQAGQLVIEARAQARVNHDRVCKVFEVGEVKGHVYIAMQYIEGEPLNVAAARLSFEQRAMVIRDAAEGVHEAHRAGIIHRDLKPGNILIQQDVDGRLKTFVLDFGIAHDRTESAAHSGTFAGTPHFMSPEQAHGDPNSLDRRADVYSLGATLYQILCWRPPVTGATPREVLENIGVVPPRPPREINRDVPPDLESIALKCLERDRSDRYDSARALSEDLDRFLDGDPVQASRAGRWYRVKKRLRKHRGLVAVGSLALTLLALSLSWGMRGRLQASTRERLARAYTSQVEQIEAMARYADLSRLHDVRQDRSAMLERMAAIRKRVEGSGPLAAAPGAYALGRGYLALGDDARALPALQEAWDRGFQEPRVAYALALVLGHHYQRAHAEVERIKNDSLRASRQASIEATYRDPALAYLRQSAGADIPSRDYLAALIAFYEGRFDEALARVGPIQAVLPWFYEAPQLRGDILLARGTQAFRRGNRSQAKADFDAARAAYATACAIGDSVPALWTAAGTVEATVLVMQLYGEGDITDIAERGLRAAGHALTADPSSTNARLLSARLHRRIAEDISLHGGDAATHLNQALSDARSVVEGRNSTPAERLELVRVHLQFGESVLERGKDPTPHLKAAEGLLDQFPEAERDYETLIQSGLIAHTWADFQEQVGENSATQRARAIAAYRAATSTDGTQGPAWINLGTCLLADAKRPGVSDPGGQLQKAREALDRARALDPKHVVPYLFSGHVLAEMADRTRRQGGDPRAEMERALQFYLSGIETKRDQPQLHNAAGFQRLALAAEAWERGEPPWPLLNAARRDFTNAIQVAPDQGWAYINLCESWTTEASYRSQEGANPSAWVNQALLRGNEAVHRMGSEATVWSDIADAHLVLAEFDVNQSRDPSNPIQQAMSAITNAWTRNKLEPAAARSIANALTIRARWDASQGRDANGVFQQAATAYERAMTLAPNDQGSQLDFARCCRDWAGFLRARAQDPASALSRAERLAEALLQKRPQWAEAQVLRGSLWLETASAEVEPNSRRQAGLSAMRLMSSALATNPHLEFRWRPSAAAAKALADGTARP